MRTDSVRWLQDAIEVDVTGSAAQQVTTGGSKSSLENNNVFGTEPKVYSGVSRMSHTHCTAVYVWDTRTRGCQVCWHTCARAQAETEYKGLTRIAVDLHGCNWHNSEDINTLLSKANGA